GLDQERIARIDLRRFDFARGKFFYLAIRALDRNSIRQRVLAAVQSPRRADGPLHMGVNRRRPAHAYLVCHAETTAKLAGTAGVLAQGASLDDDRTLGFGRFYRRVVRVAVIKTHRRAHAVLIVLGAPTTTWMADMRPEKAPGRCIETMRVDGTEIGVMSGDRAFRTRRRQGAKNRIAHGH